MKLRSLKLNLTCFFVPFSNAITSLVKGEVDLCASRVFVCLFILHVSVLFSYSWYRGLAAFCDCATPLNFL